MASFETIDHFGPGEPPRPTTPPIRKGFVLVFLLLCLVAALVYGIPHVAEKTGYALEAGRARAAREALGVFDKNGAIEKSDELFRLAAQSVAPSVVNIRTYRTAQPKNAKGKGLLAIGSGSGVVIDKAHGLIVTNQHVIRDGEELIVRPRHGGEYSATVVGADARTDLAVIQIKAPLQSEAVWGDSDQLVPAQWVLAIGSPFNLDQSVVVGNISATGRNNLGVVGENTYEDFIQTSLALNPGNSGGPLVDLRGQVVGINTAISIEGGSQGIGLAISSNLARKIVSQLIQNGRVVRGYLGVSQNPMRGRIPGRTDERAARIDDVDSDSPADRAGLKPGDLIVKLADQPIRSFETLRNVTLDLTIGQTVPLEFRRDGKNVATKITIAPMPSLRLVGLGLRDARPDEFDGPGVVIDQVLPGSPAFASGVLPGYRVIGVGDHPVKSKAEAHSFADKLDPNAGSRF